ncbi:nuclear transport factor 2 family protein [Sphingobium sp. CAP-1]|uniref:nuclear transport factor 2 family protein n=1 Tax=Sphingobium sp. CAP-1 TaxID=2676077 RepID=UPI0012BB3475|nr:nuclear transport factor 2 family protein [Sphingobium sp. CAP-1]QGP81038.1 nuclear transport factor 2 family protein [Sphingobium sp. CAP-1]
MNRADYERYAQAFNDRDYDRVFDHYAPGASIRFFGVDLGDREAFKRFYNFLHAHVIETLTIERFAASDDLVALEGTIRVEATQDLDAATLAAHGLDQFMPIMKGQVQQMRQYIHYHVADGKFTSVGCAIIGLT